MTENRVHIPGTNCYSVIAIDTDGNEYFMEGYDDSEGMSVLECRDAARKAMMGVLEDYSAVAVTGSKDWGEDHEVFSDGDLEAVVRWRRCRLVQSSS